VLAGVSMLVGLSQVDDADPKRHRDTARALIH